MLAVVGAAAPFEQGRQQMEVLAGLEVTTKAVERTAEVIGADIAARDRVEIERAMQLDFPIVVGEPVPILYVLMDGTGVPVVRRETEGRQGKLEGQPAHTREVKLGCSFTQTTWDEEGYPIRDPDSTTYVGAIETAEEFGKRIYLEAWKRGWSRALKKVVMGDGSEWIWNQAALYFPGATQILDLYHAREHLWDLARRLYPNEEALQKRWMMVHGDWLENCKIKKLVASLQSIQPSSAELAEKLRVEAEYFRKNARRMRYPKFRRQHLFVGTGVIEAGCKTVIGSRCKQSGMFWTVRGATPSWHCAARSSTAASRTTGRPAMSRKFHFYVAHPARKAGHVRSRTSAPRRPSISDRGLPFLQQPDSIAVRIGEPRECSRGNFHGRDQHLPAERSRLVQICLHIVHLHIKDGVVVRLMPERGEVPRNPELAGRVDD